MLTHLFPIISLQNLNKATSHSVSSILYNKFCVIRLNSTLAHIVPCANYRCNRLQFVWLTTFCVFAVCVLIFARKTFIWDVLVELDTF